MKSGQARPEVDRFAGKTGASGGEDKKEAVPGMGATLSGLLNVLDGFSAPDSVVYVMTSNVVENLDPALLRPGRIDYKLYMGQADDRQKVELYQRFFPDATEGAAELFVETHRSVETMADFQGLLLKLEQDCTELDELVVKV